MTTKEFNLVYDILSLHIRSRAYYLPQLDRNGHGKDKDMDLENDQEEGTELVEHLDEKVPAESQVGGQIADSQAIYRRTIVWLLSCAVPMCEVKSKLNVCHNGPYMVP